MEREISLQDVRNAVYDAYEQFKSVKEGSVDPRIKADDKTYGISVVLTDGTVVNKGDAEVSAVLGEVARMPIDLTLLMQEGAQGYAKKMYTGKKVEKHLLSFSHHAVRAISAIEPTGDRDGKWDIIINNIINAMGSAPDLDDNLYKTLVDEATKENAVDKLAAADYVLYDDAKLSVDMYCKLMSMKVTAQQLAQYGATIAADGRNAVNGQVAFDGTLTAPALALLHHGIHHESKVWNLTVGVPARSGRGGFVVAVMPGFGAIVALSPEVDEHGVSAKAKSAVAYIASRLGLNVFESARVKVSK